MARTWRFDGGIMLGVTSSDWWRCRLTSSSVDSWYTCYRSGSCASDTSASWPITRDPRRGNFLANSWEWRPSFVRPKPLRAYRLGLARNVVDPWLSSKGWLLFRWCGNSFRNVSPIPRSTDAQSIPFRCAAARPCRRVSAPNLRSLSQSRVHSVIYKKPPPAPSDYSSPKISRTWPSSSPNNINPHSHTFSIAARVPRKRQRLPSNLVIENPRQHTSAFYLYMARCGFPMNASGYSTTWTSLRH